MRLGRTWPVSGGVLMTGLVLASCQDGVVSPQPEPVPSAAFDIVLERLRASTREGGLVLAGDPGAVVDSEGPVAAGVVRAAHLDSAAPADEAGLSPAGDGSFELLLTPGPGPYRLQAAGEGEPSLPLDVLVSATAAAPEEITPSCVRHGLPEGEVRLVADPAGGAASFPVRLTSACAGAVEVRSIALRQGTPALGLEHAPLPQRLEPGAALALTVTFTPSVPVSEVEDIVLVDVVGDVRALFTVRGRAPP